MLFNEPSLCFGLNLRWQSDPVHDKILVDPRNDLFLIGNTKNVISSITFSDEAAWFRPISKHCANASKEGAVSARTQLLTQKSPAEALACDANVEQVTLPLKAQSGALTRQCRSTLAADRVDAWEVWHFAVDIGS